MLSSRNQNAEMTARSGSEPSPEQSARTICVVGMHRSGTSLTASLIREMGVTFGPTESMMAAHPADNAAGYMEQRPLQQLNDSILSAMGGDWMNPPELGPGWQDSEPVRALASGAAEQLATLYPEEGRWGWKDPRTSLTLPFWQELIGPMDYVICLRSPAAVAASLELRYNKGIRKVRPLLRPGFRRRNWYRLWLRYTEDALRHTEGSRRLVVVYEDYHHERDAVIGRLADFLGLPPAPVDDKLLGMVRGDLWRQREVDSRLLFGAEHRHAAELFSELRAGRVA
jgi:hypothetical protein